MDEISINDAANALTSGENTSVEDKKEETLESVAAESDALIDALQDQDTKDEKPAPRFEKVKIDGEESDVAFDDLVASHQKVRSADKRFEEAAKIRKEAESRLSTLETDRQQMAAAARYFEEQAQSLLPPAPLMELLNTDPVEYLRQDRIHKDRMTVIAQAQTAQAHLQRLQDQERNQRESEVLTKNREFLLKEIPAWADEAKAGVEQKRVADHMRKLGNDDQRINTIKSYGDVVAYRESMLYRDLLSQAKERTKQMTKVPRVERSGTGERGPSDSMQRFRKSGSFEDALAALNSGLLS